MTIMNGFHRWLCRSAGWQTTLERTLLPWALEDIDLGDDLLEVGPGPGLTTDILRKRVARLTAIEIDRRLTEALKLRLAGTNVRVIDDDATETPLSEQMFSAAVALTMLHHIPSAALQDKLLLNVCSALRPGGVFAGTDNTVSLRFRLIHIGDTMVPVDPDTFGGRLEKAGFTNIRLDTARQRFRFRARRAGGPKSENLLG